MNPPTPVLEKTGLVSLPATGYLPSVKRKTSGPKVKNSLLLEFGVETLVGGGTRITNIDRRPSKAKRRKQTSLIRAYYLSDSAYKKKGAQNFIILFHFDKHYS